MLILAVTTLLFLVHSQEPDEVEPGNYEEAEPGDHAEVEPEGARLSASGEPLMSSETIHALHSKIDGNGDGKMTMQELMAFATATRKAIDMKILPDILDDMDLDKDGKLSFPEVEVQGEGEEKFKIADANGDGYLEKDELASYMLFDKHTAILEHATAGYLTERDEDFDGKLTPVELHSIGPEGEEALSVDMVEEFATLDVDKDGLIDLEELKALVSGHLDNELAMKQIIEMSDSDNDTQITAAELDEALVFIAESRASGHLHEWAEHHEL